MRTQPIRQDIASNRTTINEQTGMTTSQMNSTEKDYYDLSDLLAQKGFTETEFKYLKIHFGSTKKAKDALISYATSSLDKIIADTIEKEKALKDNINNNTATKWLKRRFSAKEIKLLKGYYHISDDDKLMVKIENTSDYDMDKLMYKLKQPYRPEPEETPAYSGASSDTDASVGLAETESVKETSSIYNRNYEHDFSPPEIELLKKHFRVRSKYEAIALADTLSDYELDRILNKQKIIEHREGILDNAYEYLDFRWTPTKDLEGWKDSYTYEAGVEHKGVPYSQNYYRYYDLDAFKEALDNYENNSFYDTYIKAKDGIQMPKYGTDCSAFVSDVWDYDTMTTIGLSDQANLPVDNKENKEKIIYNLDSMYDLKPGDAILKSGSHVRLVVQVIGDTIYCIEQTTDGTYRTQKFAYNIDKLISEGYKPISKFNP